MLRTWQESTTGNNTQEAITLAVAKAHLRVEDTEEDAVITAIIHAATASVQNYIQSALLSSNWYSTMPSWASGGVLVLPMGNVSAITKVEYYDGTNTLVELAATNYVAALGGMQASIQLKSSMPSVYDRPDAIKITFVAGHASADLIPAALVEAVKLLTGHYFENREAVSMGSSRSGLLEIPMGVKYLCNPYKIAPYL